MILYSLSFWEAYIFSTPLCFWSGTLDGYQAIQVYILTMFGRHEPKISSIFSFSLYPLDMGFFVLFHDPEDLFYFLIRKLDTLNLCITWPLKSFWEAGVAK